MEVCKNYCYCLKYLIHEYGNNFAQLAFCKGKFVIFLLVIFQVFQFFKKFFDFSER